MNPGTGEYSANPRRSRIARQSSRVWGQRISANHDTDTINYSTHRGFHVRVTKVVASQRFWRLMRGRIKGSEISLRANFAERLPMVATSPKSPWRRHISSLELMLCFLFPVLAVVFQQILQRGAFLNHSFKIGRAHV